MDEAALYNLHSRGGSDTDARKRLDRLERAFARYLRQEGWHLRDIARLLDIKLAKVKELLEQ